MSKPIEQYTALQEAFDWLNRDLFNAELPQAIIVLHRKKNAKGYFWAEMWRNQSNDSEATEKVDEIALTPEYLDRSDIEVLSTLAHEMVHLWQFHCGKPSRSGYHNRQWADKMIEIGLQPTTDGTPQGKETGQKCTHFIIGNDRFHRSMETFLAERKVINWIGLPIFPKEAKAKNKVKYTCSACGSCVWGKLGLSIVCGICEESYQVQE